MKSPKPALETENSEGAKFANSLTAPRVKAPTAASYLRTLSHLRWSQIGYLALRRVLPRSQSPASVKGPVVLHHVAGPWRFPDWQPETSRKMIAAREFTFLNKTVVSNGSIPWNDRRHAKLWLYHLNYFDFLNVGFALPEDEPMLRTALEIALDWCARNGQGTEVGWEPYALSVRIVNWLKFLARHEPSLELTEEREKIDTLLESLGAQAATLERRLEKDLLGNHFLKNIKALLFAGALLETSGNDRWWAKGEALLEQQLYEQILPDGGHFERSPMYHSQVLEDFFEIQMLSVATEKRLACADLLSRKIGSMALFLKGILHPDGDIPLFNDSVLGGARQPAELLSVVETPDAENIKGESKVTLFPETGYGVIRNPESRSALIFDCGPLGPNYQPGHGHCDVLSYELSLQGQRVVVDSGVSTYEPGPERHYERSTSAHNTLLIDDEEQAEIWASFRVGRRPRVGQIRGGEDGGFPFVSGEHDAYRRLGVVHARKTLLCPPDTWIVADLLAGRGTHAIESFLHFHPRVHVEPVGGAVETIAGLPIHRWTAEFEGQSYLLRTYGNGQFELKKTWYAEQFGNRQPSTALRWAWRGTMPAGMIHVFAPAGTSLPHLVGDWSANWIEIAGHKIPIRQAGRLT